MARFPAQGSGGGGGAGTGHVIQDEGSGLPQQPILDFIGDGVTASDGTGKTEVNIPGGGGGVVEKLGGEIKSDSSSNVFTIPITPNRTITDYSEFWVIFNGQVVADDDIFMQINGFTSSSYDNVIDTISQNPLTRELAGSISQNKVIGFFGTNEQVTALGSCYIKWRIGAKKTGNDALMCSIESTHGNEDVGVSVMRGSHGMGKIDGFNDGTLDEIRVQTTSNNFQVGSSCQVYGVLNEGGGSGGGGSGLEILDTALLQEEFYWRELQGGGVVKLFETTVQNPATSVTATIDPPVDLVDYSEFWLICTGSLSAQDDIFAEINAITSTSYRTQFNRMQDTGTQAVFIDSSLAWVLNNSVNGEPVLINTQFYVKLVFQGGPHENGDHFGTLHSVVRALGVGNQLSVIDGAINLENSTETTLDRFIFRTGGVANLKVGTKVSVYGVSPIEGAFRQKYHVTGFVRPVGEDIQDLGVIKLETPGVNGPGFAGILGDPSSIDTGKIGPPSSPATNDESGFRVSTITRRNITMKQVLTVIDSVNSMVAVGLVETTPDNAETEAEFLAFQNNGFGFIFHSVTSPFWRIWTKQLGALTIQTTTVAPTNGINVRQTLEAKIILQTSGTPHIEYRIDGVLVGTLETNDPQSSALIMYSGVFGTDTLTTTKELDIDTWEVQVDRLLT